MAPLIVRGVLIAEEISSGADGGSRGVEGDPTRWNNNEFYFDRMLASCKPQILMLTVTERGRLSIRAS